MENHLSKTIRNSIRHWYLLLILGIVFIGVGIWVFRTPEASYLALSQLFAFTFLLAGILETVYAISTRRVVEHWKWSLAGGILGLIIGIVLLARPEISMIMLPLYIGFGILFQSIMAIGWSLELKKYEVLDWGNLLAIGILGLLFAFIMLWNPFLAGMTIVFYTALSFIIVGIFQVYLAIKLRKLRNLARQ